MAAPTRPRNIHPARQSQPDLPYSPRFVPIGSFGSDIDFTDPAGISGGICPVSILIGSGAGNLTVTTLDYTVATASLTDGIVIPVQANATYPAAICQLYHTGTTATVLGFWL